MIKRIQKLIKKTYSKKMPCVIKRLMHSRWKHFIRFERGEFKANEIFMYDEYLVVNDSDINNYIKIKILDEKLLAELKTMKYIEVQK